MSMTRQMNFPTTNANNSMKDYFKDVLTFLHDNSWLCSYQNIYILTHKLLDNFPTEWKEIFNTLTNTELNEIPHGYINDTWPESLKQFISKIESLKSSVEFQIVQNNLTLPPHFFTGLSPKKIHEITSLAPYIYETCKNDHIDTIIDIGAGLGYLPQLLFKLHGYNILAVEADINKVQTAINRQSKLYEDSINNVKYVQHFVDENSGEFLQKCVHDHFPHATRICLIGLHACADLSITLLKLFSEVNRVQQAIVMPCCYHRLKKIPNPSGRSSGEFFQNFPTSNTLRQLYDYIEANNFLTGAFLRLACQNTAAKWRSMSPEDHTIHSIGAMRRGILQLVADADGYNLHRLKRKSRNIASNSEDFSSYLEGLKNSHTLINPNDDNKQIIDSDDFKEKMISSWKIHEKDCRILEVYTGFQTSLQNICENIILLDRVQMVNEWGYSCFARKITDDCVSPRCYAIVAWKPKKTCDSDSCNS